MRFFDERSGKAERSHIRNLNRQFLVCKTAFSASKTAVFASKNAVLRTENSGFHLEKCRFLPENWAKNVKVKIFYHIYHHIYHHLTTCILMI